MRFCALLLALLGLLCTFGLSVATNYDVCVIGGGASGAASAVFLQQRGYSVKVIEKNNTLGGHCNTFDFTVGGESLWLDIGVQGYTNSTFGNLNGWGTWAIDSAAFVSQFVPSQLIASFGVGAASSSVNLAADFNTGELLTGAAINQTAFAIALETLIGIVAQYPWLNTGERPDPVPAWMLQPFSHFIEEYSLQPLVDSVMNSLVFGSGYGSLSTISTLQGLSGLSGVNLQFVLNTPYCGFAIIGGCHVLYEGIAAYLGSAVTYNATIETVSRRKASTGGRSTISGTAIDSAGNAVAFDYKCGKIIVAVYPLLQNLWPWLDLSAAEVALFSNLVAQGYMALATTFTDGSLIAGQAFGLSNLDPTQTYNLPALPDLNGFMRVLPVGPAAAWVNSDSSYTPASDMLETAWESIEGVPASIMTDIRIAAWTLHQYAPHWTNTSQGQSPSPDTILANLQGQKGTYWVGSAVVSEGSTVVWNQAYKLIQQNFPQK